MAGNCSVPITLVTLGAYFYRPSPSNPAPLGLPPSEPASFLARLNPFRRREVNEFQHVERPGPGETRTVLVAVISRMVLVPLVLLPLFGWYASFTTNVADDPVFVVVACLLIGSVLSPLPSETRLMR
jgi:predicted permease